MGTSPAAHPTAQPETEARLVATLVREQSQQCPHVGEPFAEALPDHGAFPGVGVL